MWSESSEENRPLRSGLTTGTCATACCVAAAQALLTDINPKVVSVTLPRGKVVELTISNLQSNDSQCRAATIKDAGDDPDVTHGATVFVELTLIASPIIEFKAAAGVGTVTKSGLALAVGEPAINPVPRQMMTEHLWQMARANHYPGGFRVAVGIENGEQIATKTMNGRLGILGGLSILGTTGVVRPFSCAAYIASIHQGIDVAKANGITHIAASTGSSSESAIRAEYQLADMALIEMGDFVGAVLKYLKQNPLPRLSLCGGFGKLTKLACGHMDLHSRASSIDFEYLAGLAQQQGGSKTLLEQIRGANTSIEALNLCQQENVDLAAAVCAQALQRAQEKVGHQVQVEVWAINRQGNIIGRSV